MVAILLVLSASIFLLQKLSQDRPGACLPRRPTRRSRPSPTRGEASSVTTAPVVDQYVHYIRGLLSGNLGESLRTRRAVSTDLGAYLPGHH